MTVQLLVVDLENEPGRLFTVIAVPALDIPARSEEVLVLRTPQQTGSLSELLERLLCEYVNVLHLNAVSDAAGRIVVVRFSDNARAECILRDRGRESG
ncbi:MAG: hypothetical protein ACOC2Y_03620 [Spirochaetota bacterium]